MRRVKTVFKATTALVALVALIVGLPAVLVSLVGWPLPRSLPDVGSIWDAIAVGNVPTQVVINVLACVVWIAWLQIAISVLLETKAAVQGRMPRPVRGLASPIQLGIGKLVATAALLITMFPRAGMAAPAPTVPLPRAMPAVAIVAPAPLNTDQLPATQPRAIAVRSAMATESTSSPPSWTVARGDNLWDIAETVLGSGDRWPEIFELNRGALQPDGRSLTDPGVLERGWELRLPDHSWGSPMNEATTNPTSTDTSAATGPAVETYTVERGDSLWGIAVEHLGDGHRYRELFDANRGVAQPDGGSLVDPGVIEPGWRLTIPADAQPASTPPNGVEPAPANPPPAPTAATPAGQPPAPTATAPTNPPAAPAAATPAGPPIGQADQSTNPPVESPKSEESATTPSTMPAPPTSVTPTAGAPAEPSSSAPPDPALEPAGMPPPSLEPAGTPPPSMPTTSMVPPLPTSEASAAPANSVEPPPSTSVEAPTVSAPPPSEPPQIEPEANTEMGSSTSVDGRGVLGGAGGVLAVGLWAALRRRRHHQSIRRRPGTPTPPPNADLFDVLGSLRATALASPAASVASLLRTLATGDRSRKGMPEPQPVAVIVGPDTVSVMLRDAAGSPPTGWSLSADERRWEHPRRHRLPDVDAASPLPALVTIGGTTDEPVLLDLEAAGVISITGDEQPVSDLVRSLVLELAETPFADSVSVLVDGVDIPALAEYPRLRHVDDQTAALAELGTTAHEYEQALADAGLASCFTARAADVTGDGLPPTILITTTTTEEVAEVARLLPGASGAVLVVLGEIDAPALEIRVDEEHVEVPELGIRCDVQRLDADIAKQIGEAMAGATADPVLDDDEATAANAMRAIQIGAEPPGPMSADDVLDLRESPSPTNERYEDPPFDVCVRMLGSVTVTGAGSTPTAQQEAILSYLITHRSADSVALQEALWRDNQPRKSRLHDVLYELRRSLGPEVLPATADNTNPLGPLVVSDLELFDQRIDAARQQSPETAIETLCGALELVRGTPFTYGARAARYYTWVDVENFISTWEHTVADVAHEVSKWFHREGDASTAAWAARQGLLASPLNEALTCDLMLSHDLAGDSRAAQSVFDEHERALEALGLGEAGDELIVALDQLRASRSSPNPQPPVTSSS